MNQNNKDRQLSVFEIDANDDETDVVFLEQAYAYHQQLVAEENDLPLTRNPINRDREGAEERLMADYFNDHCRKPTVEDVENIYNKHLTTHDFLGMLGNIDCMHWEWKNCPVSWQGQYDANNDINVLDNSSLFDDLLNDTTPVVPYVVNGVGYEKEYYLADGIYPQWATFVKYFTVANDAKHAYFKKRQEGARKDVERAFNFCCGLSAVCLNLDLLSESGVLSAVCLLSESADVYMLSFISVFM
ncbi:ALP1-like protein isoform X1 [Tanacetum coccineum]